LVGTGEVLEKSPTPDFVAAAAFALPIELESRLLQAQNQIDNTPGYNGKAKLAFTEWLFIGEGYQAPSFTNTGGAIITGGFLNMPLGVTQIRP
jgi:alpha-N-arabinofuranosidase